MTAKDWLDKTCSWHDSALATRPCTDTVPPWAGRVPGLAPTETTAGYPVGGVLAEATAGWPRPNTPHVASTSVGSMSNDITIDRPGGPRAAGQIRAPVLLGEDQALGGGMSSTCVPFHVRAALLCSGREISRLDA